MFQKRDKSWGSLGGGSFSFCFLEQNWLCVSAAAEGPHRRKEVVVRMQQEVEVKEGRWTEENPQRWRLPKGEHWTEMKKEAESYWCTLLNGLAWSTEKKFFRRYKGKWDIFFGMEHRLRKEEME